MALPSVPPISLSQVRTEFGAPGSATLGAMVKGGAYVPANVVGGSVPAAPPISLSNFYGARKPATLTYVSASADNGYVLGTVTPAPDLSTISAAITRNTTVNGAWNASFTGKLSFLLQLGQFSGTPTARIGPATGAPLVGGFYQWWSARSMFLSQTPGGTSVVTDAADGVGSTRFASATSGTYTGRVQLQVPYQHTSNLGAPQTLTVDGSNRVSLDFTMILQAAIDNGGFGPFSNITEDTGSTSITFSVTLYIYDGDGTLILTKPIAVTITFNCQLAVNHP